ncbi:toll/interleukin-1 receptor domain-containing protein [Oscillatoria sp. FACHB-1407]|uniref:toll/interleukin-1 receptor domain-containing protein n=1 Tax=Oscillatoria sp. FACHB-1407 TaxID=2692847 RepID=UPI001684F381|nr:toll/interleukin-1 receptor domain-containing protein [Oscillatoria sp. FACHB-1407]MBD2464161.1 toll/interleukin-1 receptor domain-containing protein [Oscillatoria sp. FACHB-1407]
MANPAIRVFYSYSRQDREMCDRLDEHLSHLRRSGKIVPWCDLQLEPGSEWEKTLLEKLETADIILLLVSARFLASDYCSNTELRRAIDRHNSRTGKISPRTTASIRTTTDIESTICLNSICISA